MLHTPVGHSRVNRYDKIMHNWLRPQYRDQHNLNLGDRVKSDRGRLLCNKWLLWG